MTSLIHIHIHNHGPIITSTNYWQSDLARRGLLYASVNAGAIRLLLPQQLRPTVNVMRASRYVICSRGPWAGVSTDGVELLFEDGTDRPYAIHLDPASFDVLPGPPEDGKEWVVTVWDERKGRPHQCLQRVCHWRRVGQIPCLEPWAVPGEE